MIHSAGCQRVLATPDRANFRTQPTSHYTYLPAAALGRQLGGVRLQPSRIASLTVGQGAALRVCMQARVSAVPFYCQGSKNPHVVGTLLDGNAYVLSPLHVQHNV